MIDPVPWLVGGGAVHSAEVARALAYIAVGGASGIATGTDLRVTQLAVPGASVTVSPGAFAIENTYSGQFGQSYVGRAPSETTQTITATGGSARSDMLVVRIDDPQYGGTNPVDPTVGPYASLAIISNVGSTATEIPAGTTFPCIPLARIDVPAGTATITDAMIVDLRNVISPRRQREVQIVAGAGTSLTTTVASPGQVWPKAGGWDVLIPKWATKVIVTASISGMKIVGDGSGFIWVRMGNDAEVQFKKTGNVVYDTAASTGSQRASVIPAGVLDIDPSLRGQVVNFSFRGYVNTGTGAMRPLADSAVASLLDLEFIEAPAA